jgi:hypothetical protein
MPNSGVNWYGDKVLKQADAALKDVLETLGREVLQEAQDRAPVDTGFLKESGYIDAETVSTFQSRTATLTSPKTGQTRDYSTVASAPQRDDNTASVGFAADYAIYVEGDQPFLYPALVSVSNRATGLIEKIVKDYFR